MPSRRRLLAASALALVGNAGCIGDSTVLGATDDGSDDVLFTVSDGDEEADLVTYGDVATVGEVETADRLDGYRLRISLTDGGADAFADGLGAIGAFEDPTAHRIRSYLDGEVIYTATLGPDLAAAVEDGAWDGEMLVQFDDRETAEEMRAALERA